jgi:hypothetical protein
MDEQTSDDNDYLRFLFLFILNLINNILVYSKKIINRLYSSVAFC